MWSPIGTYSRYSIALPTGVKYTLGGENLIFGDTSGEHGIDVDPTRVDRIVETLESDGACVEPDVISVREADRANAVIGELLEKEANAENGELGQQRIAAC